MTTFVALLRGINVGKAKRVPVADLRGVLDGLGFGNLHTLLNSGNVVFTHPAGSAVTHAKSIADGLRSHFGFPVPVIVKTAADLGSIVEHNTLASPDLDPSKLLVIFAQTARPPTVLRQLATTVRPPDCFIAGEHAAYLYCPDGILASPFAERTLSDLGELVTTRNWATALKLLALATPRGA